MPELHPAQFADQQALPGMEEHAHPWARPLSRGYRLSFHSQDGRHQLQAHDMNDSFHRSDAYLEWQSSGGPPSLHDHVPGEVEMVHNWAKGTEHGRGLARGLFESAHHFDFGQDTLPVHSPLRSPEGKAFSERVRPDLNPDVWTNAHTLEEHRPEGKPRHEAPHWPGVGEEFHPFQQQRAKAERQAAEHMRQRQGHPRQGKLF